MENKMPKPKNCPKCNQPPTLIKTFDGVCGFTQMHFVVCQTCGIRTYAHLTQMKAAEAWNSERELITTGGVFK